MSEAELLEAIQARQGQMIELTVIFLSLVSAYIVMAYTMGSKLTRAQATFVSTLFVAWTVSNCLAMATSAHLIESFWQELSTVQNAVVPPFRSTFAPTLVYVFFVNGGAILGSLWFMWSIRHPRNQ